MSDKSEIELLKERAKTLGVSFHPNIGLENLKTKIEEKLGAKEENSENSSEEKVKATKENPGDVPEETKIETQVRLRKEAQKLVRVRITCMNPNKKEIEGEFFTASNSLVGTIKKFVPFDNSEGWMVPQIILNMIQERECQVFYTKKVNGVKMRKGKLIKEFAVEILDPLTEKELKELADRQSKANSID